MVFVAFMQYCIQSKVPHLTHVERVESVFGIKLYLTLLKYSVKCQHSIKCIYVVYIT